MDPSTATTDIKMRVLFYAVRHGETTLNTANKFRGPIDIKLSDQGRKQATEAGKILKDVPASLIVHSEKHRTRETARTIAKHQKDTKVPVTGTVKLRSWNLGEFAGKPKNKANLKKLQEYIDDPSKTVPKGESLNDFKNRVNPVFNDVLFHAAAGHIPILVVHASVIHEIGTVFNGDEQSVLVDPGGIVAVVEDNGKIHAEIVHRPDGHEAGGIGG